MKIFIANPSAPYTWDNFHKLLWFVAHSNVWVILKYREYTSYPERSYFDRWYQGYWTITHRNNISPTSTDPADGETDIDDGRRIVRLT